MAVKPIVEYARSWPAVAAHNFQKSDCREAVRTDSNHQILQLQNKVDILNVQNQLHELERVHGPRRSGFKVPRLY